MQQKSIDVGIQTADVESSTFNPIIRSNNILNNQIYSSPSIYFSKIYMQYVQEFLDEI